MEPYPFRARPKFCDISFQCWEQIPSSCQPPSRFRIDERRKANKERSQGQENQVINPSHVVIESLGWICYDVDRITGTDLTALYDACKHTSFTVEFRLQPG